MVLYPFSWICLSLLLLVLLPNISVRGDDNDNDVSEQWCVADVQTPDDELEAAMKWACGEGGANCSYIQENQPCYLPNTIKDHASYALNTYFQNFKHKGATCYFNGAAIITELNPSYNNCHFEYLP